MVKLQRLNQASPTKWAIRTLAAGILAPCFGQGLVFSPTAPVLDLITGNESITVSVDLSSDARQALNGEGTVSVTLQPDERLQISPLRPGIAYSPGQSTPALFTIRKNPDAPWPDNEFARYALNAAAGGPQPLSGASDVLVRGPFFQAVRRYLAAFPKSATWSTLGVSDVGALVQYRVSEPEFRRWISLLDRPVDIALASQLSLRQSEVTSWDTRDVAGVYGSFELGLRGWQSSAAYWESVAGYKSQAASANQDFSFSQTARVPVGVFLDELTKLPAAWDSGRKDYEITARYHLEEGKKLMASIGLDAPKIVGALQEGFF